MKFALLHHADQKTIDDMYNLYQPVFLLSTGRSGSKFLAELLNHSPNLAAFHEPQPTLQYFSHYAYIHQQEKDTLTKMIDVARMELILDVFIKDKIYVESNQCLTFFAPMLAQLFKKAKFVHIVRHPGDFIRSAVCKGWHKNDSIWESGRVKLADQQQWQTMDHIQRLAWLWATTHQYIEHFKHSIDPKRHAFFKMEDLVSDIQQVQDLLNFIGGQDIPVEQIKEIQHNPINELIIHPNEPPNIKKNLTFPHYTQWGLHTKEKVQPFVRELLLLYQYPPL